MAEMFGDGLWVMHQMCLRIYIVVVDVDVLMLSLMLVVGCCWLLLVVVCGSCCCSCFFLLILRFSFLCLDLSAFVDPCEVCYGI